MDLVEFILPKKKEGFLIKKFTLQEINFEEHLSVKVRYKNRVINLYYSAINDDEKEWEVCEFALRLKIPFPLNKASDCDWVDDRNRYWIIPFDWNVLKQSILKEEENMMAFKNMFGLDFVEVGELAKDVFHSEELQEYTKQVQIKCELNPDIMHSVKI